MNRNVKIKRSGNIFGTVSLSGDSDAAICIICLYYFLGLDIQVSNVPRSESVLNFYNVLNKINAGSKWVSEDTIKVIKSFDLNTDISFMHSEKDFDLARLLMAVLLEKEGECTLNPEFRAEAKFYRKIGYEISAKGENIKIIRPPEIKDVHPIDVSKEDIYGYFARMILESSGFNNLNFIGIDKNPFYLLFKERYIDNSTSCICPYSLREFNFFSMFGKLTKTDVNIESYNISEVLKTLLLYDQFGIKYEISENKIKLWSEEYSPRNYYDLSNYSLDLVGYVFSLITLYGKGTTDVLVREDPSLKKLATDMNIMGAKINLLDEESKNYALVRIKPSEFGSIKNMILNKEWGGVIIFSAINSEGSSTFENFNDFSSQFYNFKENLDSLNINFS